LYPETVSELEIARAIYYVKTRNIDLAIESLKKFEKRDENMMAQVATNLGFLYLLE
jgi:intraflagellar transport protein 88